MMTFKTKEELRKQSNDLWKLYTEIIKTRPLTEREADKLNLLIAKMVEESFD